jgi:hypothetical protein
VRGRHQILCYDLRKSVALAKPPPRPAAPAPAAPAAPAVPGKKVPPWLKRKPQAAVREAEPPQRVSVATEPRAIEDNLKSRYLTDRKAAVRAFGKLTPEAREGMIPVLRELFTAGTWPTQWAAALALERLGRRAQSVGAALAEHLVRAVREQSPGEIELAALLLHRCDPERIAGLAPALAEMVKGDDLSLARHACIAVTSLGPKLAQTRDALTALAGGEDAWQAKAAKRAIEALDRDPTWTPLPMEGLRPTHLDYADRGNAKREKVRDEQW